MRRTLAFRVHVGRKQRSAQKLNTVFCIRNAHKLLGFQINKKKELLQKQIT